jgi:hypothetical protein
MPPGCAIVGIRGSTGSGRFIKDFPFDRKANAICIGDNDRAGEAWHDEGGFLDQLREKVARVICFRPQDGQHKDLNDLYRAGIFDGEAFLETVRARLKPLPARVKRETFLKWCRAHSDREDNLGRAARFILRDKDRPKGRKSIRRWHARWDHLEVSPELRADLEAALEAWLSTVPASEPLNETVAPSPSPSSTPA